MTAPLTLLEQATLLGRYRFVELGCFARLGARAASAPAPGAGPLAGAARAHAFRAGLIETRLPVSVGLPHAEELTVPGALDDATLDELLGGDPEALPNVLAGALYPAMLVAYRSHLERCGPFADPPVARLLSRVVADLEAAASVLAGGADLTDPSTTARLDAIGGVFGPAR